jgi:hypothetical protein
VKRTIALCCVTVLAIAGLVPAYGAAKHLFTGKDIKNRSLTGRDIKKGSLPMNVLSKSVRAKIGAGTVGNGNTPASQGEQGNQGPQGAPGQNGAPGRDGAAAVGAHWSIIQRNTEKGGIAQLINGPFVGAGANGAPPYGQGSLNLQTADSNSKVAFGDQVDFVGDAVADIDQVGFHVMPTGEDLSRGEPNMPSITFEIDPNVGGQHYSSLVFVPHETTANQWSGYIDGTNPADGDWGFTGSYFNPGQPQTDERCGINGSRCSWDEIKAFLATGSGATVLTAGVSKGKDYEFQGAVDGLRINNQVFDFELFGVVTRAP